MGVKIHKVLELSEVNSIMAVQFGLKLKWYDPRLIYFNLKLDKISNKITHEKAERIWQPRLVFKNTEAVEKTKVPYAGQHFMVKMHVCKVSPGNLLEGFCASNSFCCVYQ